MVPTCGNLQNRNDSKTSADDLIKDLQENVYKTLNRKRQELDLQRFELKQKRERAQEEELRLRDLICDGTALGLDPDKYIEELQRQAAEEMKKATVKQEEDPTPSGESSRRGHENEEAKEKKKKSSLLNPEKIGMTKRKMKPVKDISTKPVFGNHEVRSDVLDTFHTCPNLMNFTVWCICRRLSSKSKRNIKSCAKSLKKKGKNVRHIII